MKLMLGLPWYAGADPDTEPLYMDQQQYFGALQERSLWRRALGAEKFAEILDQMPPLTGGPEANPTLEEWDRLGVVEVALAVRTRLSLVGKARELLAEDALEWGADYLMSWDADIQVPYSLFLDLWRNQVPVVGALAFTARDPVHPVIYRMRSHLDAKTGFEVIDGSDVIFDYPRGQLVGNEEIGGELAFGAGAMLIDTRVFREMPKPWFNSTGCGEDWFFCHRCSKYGIPRYVDTRVRTGHKGHSPKWITEAEYQRSRELNAQAYDDVFGPGQVRRMKGGVVI